ncbi:hypothetical protein AB0N17_24240 [Streptomyces sp. NPDC051133]|uniref:hypothetical protein n=1 Tax=Streptomyces sp. NPDC051133 TaxID=3155521 RepID=UPI0034268D3F
MQVEAEEGSYDDFLNALGGSLARLAALQRGAEHVRDVADLDTNELKNALRNLLEDAGQEVIIAWPGDNMAVRAAYRDVLERIDDLWYPSMDDLVMIDDRTETRRIIVLDHEERLFAAELTD